jgi:hypothetical protein
MVELFRFNRFVFGEVRGEEAFEMPQAMSILSLPEKLPATRSSWPSRFMLGD